MIIARTIDRTRKIIAKKKKQGLKIGFVPTMGSLHLGHLSLVEAANKETDFVVVSIFVNPKQFGAGEDYGKYPRDFKKDKMLLRKAGVGLMFYPGVKTMYMPDFSVFVGESSLSRYLCTRTRPGHFNGVCTVVTKLFNIITPDISYFGQKDYQQAQIIKRLVRDLNFPVKIKVLPIVREKDNLAMSSRNIYLNKKERNSATCLYYALELASNDIARGEKDAGRIIRLMRSLIKRKAPKAKIDYIKIVGPVSLKNLNVIKSKVLISLAVYIGKTRLIDNKII